MPSGRLRSGCLISPAESVAWYQPSKLPRTATIASPIAASRLPGGSGAVQSGETLAGASSPNPIRPATDRSLIAVSVPWTLAPCLVPK